MVKKNLTKKVESKKLSFRDALKNKYVKAGIFVLAGIFVVCGAVSGIRSYVSDLESYLQRSENYKGSVYDTQERIQQRNAYHQKLQGKINFWKNFTFE